MGPLELLGHPVRLRVVHALRGGRTLTTTQLAGLIPDVSKATLYRHVDLLADGGIIEVAEEERVRGAVQRHYRLRHDRASIDPAVASTLTPDGHRRGFAAATAALLAEFNAYLERDETDLTKDPIGYLQHAIWLTDEELLAMIEGLRAAILPNLANESTPTRRRYLLSPILFPAEDQPPKT